MGKGASLPAAVEAVERVAARATTPDELFESVAAEVHRVVPHDGATWFGVDPSTLLATAPSRFEGMDAGYCDTYWHAEFHHQDASLFRDLARQPVPAAALRELTDDRPMRSNRFREFIAPQGYDDELRGVFRTGDSTWGIVGLYRDKGREPFGRGDVAFLSAISPIVAAGLRAHAGTANPWLISGAPGVLLFAPDGTLLSANSEATCWLDELVNVSAGERWLDLLTCDKFDDLDVPSSVTALLARARAVADSREATPARLRLRDRNGRWLVLHASSLSSRAGDVTAPIAVVVEPAKSADIAPIIIEAYALSPRERDVVRAIARGASTADMAAELFLSPHTVRDYVKTVFDKVGVSSRGELVAKLFAEHYSDAMHATSVHED
jgi:DNA-binding CsgD family transcriptional regulator